MGAAPTRFLRSLATGLAFTLMVVGASAGPAPDQDLADTVQFLADLTAIDADCRSLSVSFGIGFQFATAHGVSIAAILPTGAMRAAFEKDLRATRASFGLTTLCGLLARHYALVVPGSVTFPYTLRGNDS